MEHKAFDLNIADILMELPLGICCHRVKEGCVFQEKYVFHSANSAFYQCIGYTSKEFEQKGNLIRSILVADDRKRLAKRAEEAANHPGKTYSDVFEILRKDGKTSHIQWNAKCLQREDADNYLICCCMSVESFMKGQSALMDRLNKEKLEKRKLNDLVYEMPVGVAVIKGRHEVCLDVANTEFLRAGGYSVSEMMENGRLLTDFIYGPDIGTFEEAVESCWERKEAQEFEIRIITKDGKVRWEMFQCRLYYYRDAVPYYILTSWDINERKELEAELRLMDEQYRMLEEVTDEFPFEYDVIQKRFRVPQKYHVNGKVPDPDVKYMDFEENLADIYQEDKEEYIQAIEMASKREMSGFVDYRMNTSAASSEPVYAWYRTVYRSIIGGSREIIRIIGRSYDISTDRKIQEKLSEEMRLDPLTRLLNKVAVGEEVKQFLEKNREGTHVLFLIDIDNFKNINDTFGHTVGDTVISDIAQIIRSQFRKTDLVGRIGGDEFVVFMKNTTVDQAAEMAEQLCRETQKQLIGDDAVVCVTLSVGLAVFGIDGDDYGTLFEMADRAMYRTKRKGKNDFSFARKGAKTGYEESREIKGAESDLRISRNTDKEFLNFAFSLLSHAKDINGSLNVLIEQIGKKYNLDIVSVLEYSDERPEMTLTNYWSNFGPVYEKWVIPRTLREFETAVYGEYVAVSEKELTESGRDILENFNAGDRKVRQIAGVKFEFSGSRTGMLVVGVHQKENCFEEGDKVTFCELGRVVAVFVSLRNKIGDDQKEIQQLQNRDKLTGLYNVDVFKQKTEEVLLKAARKQKRKAQTGKRDRTSANGGEEPQVYAILNVDINNFAYVNENFGQKVGDSILKEFARLIGGSSGVLKASRMYSDYFVALLCGKSREEIYQKVLNGNAQFEARQKKRYPASTMKLSNGICFVDDYEETFESILEGANLARKQAKEQKNSNIVIYKDDMREKRDEAILITGRFYQAMQDGEIEVYLQPKFLLKEEKIYGAEALARWRPAEGELLSPVRFIPPLENMGYVIDLDFYILEQLLGVMKRWKDEGKELFTISTNFSRRNFDNGGMDFVERLNGTLERYQIEPGYIEIEVTESVIVENLGSLKECLQKLEELGYRIAIDDFGTGYSSLSVLLEIPANVVKIDKSFTDRIEMEEQLEFVSHMGQFIRSAKEEVIFEGIESREQLEFLIACGFRYGQGYLFDKPLPVEEFERKYILDSTRS